STVVPTVPRQTPAAPAPAPPPAATPSTPYFRDTFQAAPPRLLDLQGSGRAPVTLPALVDVEGGGGGYEQGELIHLRTGWTPQGLGYDEATGETLTTYYHHETHQVRISIQDKDTGEESGHVELGGMGADPTIGAPTHGGGVSTDGEFVYVADTEHIYVYRREDIDDAAESGETPVRALHVIDMPSAEGFRDPATGTQYLSNASYLTVKDGYVYVGTYSSEKDGVNTDCSVGAVWRFKIGEDGQMAEDSLQGPITAPERAQGMTVVDGAILFTTGKQELIHLPFDEENFTAPLGGGTDISNGLIDSWAQGIQIIDGQLWVNYESGAEQYEDELDENDTPRTHLQRIPLEELDLEAVGLEADELDG
ncbi:hypothetical protein, partial [Pyxidicoccus fallax]